jgi:hypothetical protein
MQLLRIQHWIACLESEVEPPAGAISNYHLRGVCSVYSVPSGTVFPRSIPRLDLFARFFSGAGSTDFEIRVFWLDAPGGKRRVETYPPVTVYFRDGESIRDHVFRLLNVPLEGPGRYVFRLRLLEPRRVLADEFLEVIVT